MSIRTPLRWMQTGMAAAMILLCTACGLFSGGDKPPQTTLRNISVLALPDANQTTATAVDVVFVYDTTIVPLLPKNAADWFAQREELKANLWNYLDVASDEVPPAYLLPRMRLPARAAKALKVIAYANYLAAQGRAPIDLTALINARLTLAAKSISISESTPP
jgi:type VI secretion system protein